jgi:ATP-dependent protease ClpP protease subunit
VLAGDSLRAHNAVTTMITTKKRSKVSQKNEAKSSPQQSSLPLFMPAPERSVQYFGLVNYSTTERVIEEISNLVLEKTNDEIYMTVTSAGGPTGTAMSFYDHMRYVLKPNLVTIGSGDVDSSGIIIFLSGTKRYLTKNTTLLLHRAGRVFEGGKRITAAELEAMFREDNLKDYQYASVLSECSHGKLSTEKALQLMDKNTILTPIEMVSLGLCDFILD